MILCNFISKINLLAWQISSKMSHIIFELWPKIWPKFLFFGFGVNGLDIFL